MIAANPARAATGRDLVALVKPRITSLVVFTTAGGLWLAPERASAKTIVFTLVGPFV